MFKWEVRIGDKIIQEGDWGKDVVSKYKVSEIDQLVLSYEEGVININPGNGVIQINGTDVFLGVNIGGYPYSLCSGCEYSVVDVAPIYSASLDIFTKESEVLSRHLLLRYKVTKIFIDGGVTLERPVYKDVLISIDKSTVTIC